MSVSKRATVRPRPRPWKRCSAERAAGSSSSAPETDRFGRTLADLEVDGRSVTEAMIAGGHGMATRDRIDWRDRMKEAASAGIGMWGPRCGRSVLDDLVLGAAQVDPPGPDEQVLADEWVEIINPG